MAERDSRRARFAVPLLIAIVLAATAWVVTLPMSPEEWSQLSLLRGRGFFGSLRPFDEYTYYRPVWFAYLSACDRLGLGGRLAHLGVVAVHLGGSLLVYASVRRAGASVRLAFCCTVLAGTAPGTATALAWLAAGNKVFTFFFLALGVWIALGARGWRGVAATFVLGVLPAIGSSENGYIAVVLIPLVLFRRLRGCAVACFAAGLGLACVHLFVLSPQHAAGGDNRVAQLIAFMRSDPLGWLTTVGANLGRYFAHGTGIGDRSAVLGAVLLAALAILAALRNRGLLLALTAFVLLNLPASLFVGSSRQHAYLPAIGAGLVVATLLARLPWRKLTVTAFVALFVVQGWLGQAMWRDYLARAESAFESSKQALPELPADTQGILLWNVPHEYRAAFHLRFGERAKVADWPAFNALATRKDVLLPPGWVFPAGGNEVVIAYDGRELTRRSFADLNALKRAPHAWFVARIGAFTRPWIAWSEIVSSDVPLAQLALGFEAGGRVASGPVSANDVRVLSEGVLPAPGYHWEVDCNVEHAAWLVLGWTPGTVAVTENAWLFELERLPWPFVVRVRTRDAEPADVAADVHAVLGFLPAIWLERGQHRLRVELRLMTH